VQEIIPLAQAWQRVEGSLHLHLASGNLDSAALSNLKEIMSRNPGPMRVILHVNSLETKLSLQLKDAQVSPNLSLYQGLSQLLGAQNVRLEINHKNGPKRIQK